MCNDDFGQDDSTADSSSSSDPSQDTAPASPLVLMSSENAAPPAPLSPSPTDMYSKYFSLAQLTVTSLPYPNLPLDAASQANLRNLGILLDAIQDNIGSFTIASAYRSPENQAALQAGKGGAAAASMAVSHSLHSMGMAADITPTNGMTPTQFAQTIYQNPLFTALCGQLVDKSEGGNETSLHISTIVTSGNHTFLKCTPMYVGAGGAYIRMTPTQIGQWLSSSASDLVSSGDTVSDDQASEDEDSDDGSSLAPILIGGVAVLLAGFFLLKKKRKAA